MPRAYLRTFLPYTAIAARSWIRALEDRKGELTLSILGKQKRNGHLGGMTAFLA
jgi:hypothetical protein